MKRLNTIALAAIVTSLVACGMENNQRHGDKGGAKSSTRTGAESDAMNAALLSDGFALTKGAPASVKAPKDTVSFEITILDGEMLPILGAKVGVVPKSKAPAKGNLNDKERAAAIADGSLIDEKWVVNETSNVFTLVMRRDVTGQSFEIYVGTRDGGSAVKTIAIPKLEGNADLRFPVVVEKFEQPKEWTAECEKLGYCPDKEKEGKGSSLPESKPAQNQSK